jgi:NAD(P)-dependent dehydrogenase (short-subunit alcohol dehydrogenase family)
MAEADAQAAAVQTDLTGWVALVTSGGRGLGRAFALALAAAGARVAVVARTPAELANTAARAVEAGGQAAAFPADAADRGAMDRVVEQVENQLGVIDVLVSAASVYGVFGPLWRADPDVWWRTVEANLRTKVIYARAILPGMVARGHGRIINVGSAAGDDMSAYSCAYAAVLRLTSTLAVEGKARGISIFSISPGMVLTESFRHVIDGDWGRWKPRLREMLRAGRLNPPDAGARLVVFLAAGNADALSGRHVGPSIMDELAQPNRVEQILSDDLYSLQLRQ